MTDDADAPRRRRPGRPLKDQTLIPLSLRVPRAMHSGLAAMAKEQDRDVSGQARFLMEHAAREMGRKLYDLAPAPIEDLHDRLAALGLELGRLRDMIETGLNNNDQSVTRSWAALHRLHRELEAKLTAKTTELTTAIEHLQKVTAHNTSELTKVTARLHDALQFLDTMITRRDHEAADRRRPRPRVVPKAC
jgi:hypothetical protein